MGGEAWTSSRGARIARARAAVTAVHRHAAMRLTLIMDSHVLQYCWRLRVRSEARGGSASHPADDERRVTAVGVGEAKRVRARVRQWKPRPARSEPRVASGHGLSRPGGARKPGHAWCPLAGASGAARSLR